MTSEQSVNVPPRDHVRVLGNQGWVGLVDRLGNETSIVNAARVSMGKMHQEMTERDRNLVEFLVSNRHTSPLEHVMFTFIVHCPLFVRSQWHRHRTWSYNEISRRYTELDLEFYVPDRLRAQAQNDRQASVNAQDTLDQQHLREQIDQHNRTAVQCYYRLLEAGVCREQARGVLPQNMMTTFWGTVDLNNLIHFLSLRDEQHAQFEIRQYAQAIKSLVSPYVPTVARIMNWDQQPPDAAD